jgi:hypothetical protein
MTRTQQAIAAALLMGTTALHAGCGSSAGVLGGGGELPGDAPSLINNADPMARPVQVAWTAARAQRCGFFFDPAKLKANYINYESKQGGAGDQLAKMQQVYDSTFRAISVKVSADAGYCTDKKSAEIKAELNRHLAGDFSPNLPKPAQANCGSLFDPCDSGATNEPFNGKKFLDKWDKENPKSK